MGKNAWLRMAGRVVLALVAILGGYHAPAREPAFKAIVVASRAQDHSKMIAAAKPFLEQLGARNNFSVDFIQDQARVDDAFLSGYAVFVQLHLAPFEMAPAQQAALQRFVEEGKGWVGIHAAGLTGTQFLQEGTAYWRWFEDFLGGIVYSPHPAFQKAAVIVEDRRHPAMKSLPARIELSDEWYEFDRSPRPNVRVLAAVDEKTYKQTRPMGDHPIIWCNEKYRRMIYIGIGHSPDLIQDQAYTALLRDAILWAGSK